MRGACRANAASQCTEGPPSTGDEWLTSDPKLSHDTGFYAAQFGAHDYTMAVKTQLDRTLAVVGQVRNECRAYQTLSSMVTVGRTSMIPESSPSTD
jgi:hypothetical protein